VQLPAGPPPGPESPWLRVLEWGLSAAGGFLAALVTFRMKILGMERDFAQLKQDVQTQKADLMQAALRIERDLRQSIDALRKESDERHEMNRSDMRLMRSQQFLILKMVADIARHVGADKRFDDEVWRLLSAVTDTELPP